MHTSERTSQPLDCNYICRYNYTVFQDSDHQRQKIVRNSIETTMEVVDLVRLALLSMLTEYACVSPFVIGLQSTGNAATSVNSPSW